MGKAISKKQWLLIIASGVLIGFLNGFLGGGGGMICVPLLEKVLKIKNKKAHATAIAVILPLSIISSIVYIIKGKISWLNLLYVAIGTTIGGIIGAKLLQGLNSKLIRLIFAILMVVAGGWIIIVAVK